MENMDDLIKEFEERAKNATSATRDEWEDEDFDEIYDLDIHVWRKPGMGSSLQTIKGNKISIMTGVSSLLNSLLFKNVIDLKELDYMISLVKELHTEEK